MREMQNPKSRKNPELAPARSEWQTIDVAPAGRDILLCWPSGAMRVGYFNGNGWLCDGVKFDEEPTHWMLLPDPPVER
jgi:hypothetical protein